MRLGADLPFQKRVRGVTAGWLAESTSGYRTEGLPTTEDYTTTDEGGEPTTEDEEQASTAGHDPTPEVEPTTEEEDAPPSTAGDTTPDPDTPLTCCPTVATSFDNGKAWFASTCDTVYYQACGEGSQGLVQRRCGADGAWGAEDTSGCRHLELQSRAKSLLDGGSATFEAFVAFAIDLCEALDVD